MPVVVGNLGVWADRQAGPCMGHCMAGCMGVLVHGGGVVVGGTAR